MNYNGLPARWMRRSRTDYVYQQFPLAFLSKEELQQGMPHQ